MRSAGGVDLEVALALQRRRVQAGVVLTDKPLVNRHRVRVAARLGVDHALEVERRERRASAAVGRVDAEHGLIRRRGALKRARDVLAPAVLVVEALPQRLLALDRRVLVDLLAQRLDTLAELVQALLGHAQRVEILVGALEELAGLLLATLSVVDSLDPRLQRVVKLARGREAILRAQRQRVQAGDREVVGDVGVRSPFLRRLDARLLRRVQQLAERRAAVRR